MASEQSASGESVRAPAMEVSRVAERQILESVRGIRYGSVEIVIQDGKIVQIERKEKVRLAR